MAASLIKSEKQAITAQDVAAVVLGLPSPCWVAVQITASALTGTVTFETTVDGTNWSALELLPTTDLTDTALTSTATAAGTWLSKFPLAVAGVRARCSAFTSATSAVVTIRTSCI